MSLTESEFWTAVADYMEATGKMPPSWSINCGGLCAVVDRAYRDRAITAVTRRKTLRTIQHALDSGDGYNAVFLAPPGQAKPRIAWARKFARQS